MLFFVVFFFIVLKNNHTNMKIIKSKLVKIIFKIYLKIFRFLKRHLFYKILKISSQKLFVLNCFKKYCQI